MPAHPGEGGHDPPAGVGAVIDWLALATGSAGTVSFVMLLCSLARMAARTLAQIH